MPSQVWHSGTLSSTLVGSTRRVTITEVEAMSHEGTDEASDPSKAWWWDIDSGGRVMVREREMIGVVKRKLSGKDSAGRRGEKGEQFLRGAALLRESRCEFVSLRGSPFRKVRVIIFTPL